MRAFLLALALSAAAPLWAQSPGVVTDIAPVHSLASLVMGDRGAPALLLDPAADPHDLQLRPSQARALARADLVIWMGPALTPWLGETLATLAPGARSLPLLGLPGAPLRIEDDTGTPDPHAWLDPVTAAHYLRAIAVALAEMDPAQAASYAANADAAILRLKDLDANLRQQLAPVRALPLIAYHDAYRYFLARYDLPLAGYVTDSAGTAPGAAGLSALRASLGDAPVACVLVEPGTAPSLIDSLGLGARTVRVDIDALGRTLTPGPGLYEAMLRQMAGALARCAAP